MPFWKQLSKQERKRFVLWAISAFLVALTLWLSRNVLGLYAIGLILAYILAPSVDWFEKGIRRGAQRIRFDFLAKRSRGLSIIISYLILVGLLVGFIAIVIPVINREATELWNQREAIVEEFQRIIDNISSQYQLLPDQIKSQLDDSVANLNQRLADVLQTVLDQVVQATTIAVNVTVSIVLGISIVPFWTFYLLRDFPHIKKAVFSMVPTPISGDVRSIVLLMDRTVGAWMRGEIVLMLVVGVMTFIAVTILDLPYALLLAVLGGILEVVPNLGPTLASIPAILLAFTHGPIRAVVTAVTYNMIQQLENSLIVPRVMGRSLRLHPVVMMVMLVVGTEIGGLPGLLLAPILTSVLRDIYVYMSYRLGDDPLSPNEALYKLLADSKEDRPKKRWRFRKPPSATGVQTEKNEEEAD